MDGLEWKFIFMCAVICCCKSQNIYNWCPNIQRDMGTCADLLSSDLSPHRSLFTDVSKTLTYNTFVTVAPIICKKATLITVKNYVECVFEKRSCVPADWQKISPDITQAKRTIDIMCQNINDIDTACASSSSRFQSLVRCVAQRYSGSKPDVTTASGFLYYTCRLYPSFDPCAVTVYGTCKRRTASVLRQILINEKPTACDSDILRPSLFLLLLLAFSVKEMFY